MFTPDSQKTVSPNPAWVNEALTDLMPQYQYIKDCLAGEYAIKKAGEVYLPRPAPLDKSAENQMAYEAYKWRARYLPVPELTMTALVGQVFMRPPIVEVPPIMDVLVKNATGNGVSLELQAKTAFKYALGFSRGGIYTDYPNVEGYTSVLDQVEGKIRPTLNLVDPMSIINWRTIEVGAEEILSLVVIQEQCQIYTDAFEYKTEPRWRVLGLDEEGFYYQEVYKAKRKATSYARGVYTLETERIYPKNNKGEYMRFIPFTFMGSENNDPNPDIPAFYGLCTLSIGWYCNSADAEQASYTAGQPTLVIVGVDEQWKKDNAGVAKLGATGGISLPMGGSADFIQALPNSLPQKGMEEKQKLMVAAGARLVEDRSVQRTATEVSLESASQYSVLASTARNVSQAIETALRWAAEFMDVDPELVKFSLNTEFDVSKITPEARRMLMEEWQKGAITFEEYRAILMKHGIATEDAAVAKQKIEQELLDAAIDEVPNNPIAE